MLITNQLPNHLDKTIRKVFINYSEISLKQSFFAKWLRVVNTTIYTESFTSDEGIDNVAELTEGGVVRELELGEGYKVTTTSGEFAGKLTITKKARLIARDDTVKLGKMLAPKMKKMVLAMKRMMELRSHAMLDNSFVTDGSVRPGYGIVLSPDAKALFADDHTWKSTGTTFDNKFAGNISVANWDAAKAYGAHFVDAQGTPYPLQMNTIVVRSQTEQHRRAIRLFNAKLYPALNNVDDDNTSINVYVGDDVKIVATPWLTNDLNWFVTASGEENPLVMRIVQKPTLEEQDFDSSTLNITYPVSASFEVACVNMPYAWLGFLGS